MRHIVFESASNKTLLFFIYPAINDLKFLQYIFQLKMYDMYYNYMKIAIFDF